MCRKRIYNRNHFQRSVHAQNLYRLLWPLQMQCGDQLPLTFGWSICVSLQIENIDGHHSCTRQADRCLVVDNGFHQRHDYVVKKYFGHESNSRDWTDVSLAKSATNLNTMSSVTNLSNVRRLR